MYFIIFTTLPLSQEGLAIEDVGLFLAIWSILRPSGIFCGFLFGIFYGELVYFFPVLVCCTKRNLATLASAPV
jgi:hypothetical protein